MKKLVAALLLGALCSACANNRVIDGVEYEKFGLANQEEKRNPEIAYDVVWGNVFWGVMLSECMLLPTAYFFGWALYEPVGKKPTVKGAKPQ